MPKMPKLDEKTIAKANSEFLVKNGFTPNGCTWVILGNTYEIKDKLKEMGCKFNPVLKWHASFKPSNLKSVMVSVDDLENFFGLYVMNLKNPEKFEAKMKRLNDEIYAESLKNSNHVGNIGDKISIDVELKDSFYSRNYGFYIYKFVDVNGNIFTWKTGSWFEVEKGQKFNLKGTIKAHSEYRMVKETVLTRCKMFN